MVSDCGKTPRARRMSVLLSLMLFAAPAMAQSGSGAGVASVEIARALGETCINRERGYGDLFCKEEYFVEDGNATVFIKISSASTGRLALACSGVLIGRNRVLTAAHCFRDCPSPCQAEIGYGRDVTPKAQTARVLSIHLYPPLLRGAELWGNDLALLVLEDHKVLPFRQQMARILLARAFFDLAPPMLSVTGYGINQLPGRPATGISVEVDVPVASHSCTGAQSSAWGCRPFQEFMLVDRRPNRKQAADTCNGDSGGPALIPNRAPRIVVGITSRALPGSRSGCGEGGIYGLAGTLPVLEWLVSLVPDLRIVTETGQPNDLPPQQAKR